MKIIELDLTIPDNESMSALIYHLYKKLGKAITKVDYDHKNKKKKQKILKVIMVNLFNNYSLDRTKCTGFIEVVTDMTATPSIIATVSHDSFQR